MKRITDREFEYTPSHMTDLRRTFKRVKKELAERQEKERKQRKREITCKQ